MKKKNLIISLISGGGLVGTGATTAGVLVTNQDKLSKADDQVIVPLSPSAPSTDGTETKTTDSNLPKPTPIQTQNLNLIDYQRIQDMVVAREEAEKNDLHQKALALIASAEENQAKAYNLAIAQSLANANREKNLDAIKAAALNHAIDAWSKAKLAKAQEFQTKRADAAIVAHNEAAAKAEQFVSNEGQQADAFIDAYNKSVEAAKAYTQWMAMQNSTTAQYNQNVFAAKASALADAEASALADAAIVAHNEAAAAKAEQFVSSNEENQAAAFIAAYNASIKDAKLDTLKTSALNHAIDAWSKAKLAKAQEFQTKRADAAIVAHNEAAAKAEQFVSNEENQAAAFIAAYNASVKDAKLDTLKTSALNHAIDAWSKAKLAKAQEFQAKRADAAIVAHNEAAEAKELDNSQEIGAHITRDAASFINAYNKSVEDAKEYTQWMAMQNNKTAQYNQNVFDAKASALADAAIVAHNEAAEAKELDNSQEIGAHITRDAASFINAYNKSVEAAKEYTQWMAMQNNKTAQYNQNVFDAKASALADAAIVAHNEAAEAKELDNSWEIGARDQKIVAAETVARDLAVSQHKNLILLEAQKISQQNKIVSEQVTAANNGLDNAIVTLDVPGAIWQLNKTVVTSIPYANGEIEATTIYDGFESKTTIKVFEGAGSARHEITDEDKQLTLRIAERINQEITIHSRDARQSYISTHQGNITELEKTRVAYMEHARADAIKANTFTPINPNWTVVFSSKQSDGGPQLSSALNDLVSYNPKNASEAQQWITTMTKMASDDHTVVTVTSGSNFDLIFKNNNKHGSSITDPNSFNNLWTRLQDQNIRSQIRNFMQQNKEHDFTENVLALAIYLNPNQLSHSAISQNVKIQLTDAIAKVNTVKQVATSTATTRRSTSIRSPFVLTNENKAIAEKAISYLNDYSSWSASTIFAALKAELKNALAKWLTYSPSQADKLQINNWITKINNINAH